MCCSLCATLKSSGGVGELYTRGACVVPQSQEVAILDKNSVTCLRNRIRGANLASKLFHLCGIVLSIGRIQNVLAVAIKSGGAVSMKYGRAFLCAATAAACFHVASSAQAGIVYQGDFDPPLYGGTVFVDVDPSCVPLPTTTVWVSVSSCGGPVDILSLVVNSVPPGDQLTFAPPTISNAVWGLYWDLGVLKGIDTSFISPQVSGPTTGSVFPSGGLFAIQFQTNQDPDGNGGPPVANLYQCSIELCGVFGGVPATQRAFVQVPEPASLGLMLAALGAGWLARRRKAKA